MAVPYKLNYFEIESGLGTTSTFLHKGDLTANRIIKIGGTSNDILLGDGSTGSLSGKQNTITLTTSGTSGAATLIGATLNIPNYSPDLTGYVTLGTTQTITGAKTFGATITSNRINATATGSGAAVISAFAFDNAVAGSFSNNTTLGQNSPTLFVQQSGDGRIALFQSGSTNVIIESDGDINGIKDLTLTSAIKKSTIGATYTYDLPNANGTIALVGGAGVGTVTSVAALTLGTTGTDLSSTVADGTTTPVITLNVPTASATNRGALSSADWSVFNGKQAAGNYITSLTGEATASGPGAASVTLDNTAVIGKVLTGLNVTGGTVASTDSILTALGKVQNQINGLIGGSIFQGTWDANTNTPALTSSVGTNGHYYIVSVAGTTNLNGITDWEIGDWAIFAGTTWQKVDNTDAVVAVNGYTGNVSLVTGDVLEGAGTIAGRPSQLYFTDARARAAISLTTSGTSGAATYDNGTGVLNIPNYLQDLSGYVPYTGATANVDLGIYNITPAMVYISGAGTGGGGVLNLKKDTTRVVGGADAANTISVWADGATLGFNDWVSGNTRSAKFSVASITNNATRTYTLPNSDGTIALISDIPSLTGYVTLDTAQTITAAKTFSTSGGDNTLVINHSSGSGIALSITKGGNGEGLYVNKTSGTGNAATIIGTLNATTLVKNGGTSSQFLKADGSVDSTSYQPLLSDPVTGIGVTNYVPKFSALSLIGISQIYDNGTNVGINTSSPSFKLDVNGTLRVTGQLTLGSTITNGIGTYTLPNADGTLALTSQLPVNPVTGTGANGQVAFWNGTNTQTGDSALFWDNTNKRLGINKNIPQSNLDVLGSTGIYQRDSSGGSIVLDDSDTADASTPMSYIRNTSGVLQFGRANRNASTGITTNSVESWRMTNTGILQSNGAQTIQTSTGNLTLATAAGNGNILLSPNGSGNVGIGTTTITQPSAGATTLRIVGTATTKGGAIFLASSDSSVSAYIYPDSTSGLSINTSTAHPIVLRTNAIERMRLDTSGNLGLGVTPSAWEPLFKVIQLGNNGASISGNTPSYSATPNINVANNYYLATDETNKYYRNGTSGRYRIVGNEHRWETAPSGTAGNAISFTQAMTLDASGRLGIGTTSPGAKLDVTNSSDLHLNLTRSGVGAIGFNVTSLGNFFINNRFGTNVFQISDGGNVGIGTTSPTFKLQVEGSTSNLLSLYSSNNFGEFSIIVPSTNLVRFDLGTGDDLAINTSGSERMRITSAGNVGINTTNPTSKLQVVGLPEYATNALAITGGLTVGAFYHTGGVLKVVI